MKNYRKVKLRKFCDEYNFFTRHAGIYGYQHQDKPYFSSMRKVKGVWYIDVNRYIKEMYKKYPEIDGVSKRKNNTYSPAAKKLQNYLAEKPNDPMFGSLKLPNRKVEYLVEYEDIRENKELQGQLLLDTRFAELIDAYWEESFEEFEKIFLETIEEYITYTLETMDGESISFSSKIKNRRLA